MAPLIPVREGPLPPAVDRGVAIAVVLIAAAVVGLLLMLEPDPRGIGTHEQLGMAPCGWAQGPNGVPCPTCGVTTAACNVVHLHLVDAFVTQPFGAILTLLGLLLAGLAVRCLAGQKSFLDFIAWPASTRGTLETSRGARRILRSKAPSMRP